MEPISAEVLRRVAPSPQLDQFGGNFVNAEMVKAFLTSSEYRQRFGAQ